VRLRRVRLRLRVRRGRPVSGAAADPGAPRVPARARPPWPDLPPAELCARQSERLAGMRSRLLRRAGIAHLGPVLDLGAGYGAATAELGRRSRGPVVALDRRPAPLRALGSAGAADTVAGDALALPFADRSFDLVFAQLLFLWVADLDRALAEVERVLRPGGILLAVEPDYGGAVEHPPEIAAAALWEAGLRRAGADPRVGRRLIARLRARGFAVEVDLPPSLPPPDPDRLDLLAGLVGEQETAPLRAAERALAPDEVVAYVPIFFITARPSFA
jgi:SAM-dependent methyltransferase